MNDFTQLFYSLSVQAQIAVGLALIVALLLLILFRINPPVKSKNKA